MPPQPTLPLWKRVVTLVPLGLVTTVAALASPPLPPRYDLSIRLFPEQHRLEARGTVDLPAAPAARESPASYPS